MFRSLPLLTLLLVACSGTAERTVTVRVLVPALDGRDAPAAGVGFLLLPYDRDSLLAALEAKAATPRPGREALDSLFARYREPFVAYSAASYAVSALEDSAGRAPDDTALQRRLAEARARRTAAQGALDATRRAIGPRIDSLRTAMRRWENSTFQEWPTLSRQVADASGRQMAADTTGADGWATLPLPSGRWWVHARSWDVTDPNREWYWNLPVTADTVILDGRSGTRRPRY